MTKKRVYKGKKLFLAVLVLAAVIFAYFYFRTQDEKQEFPLACGPNNLTGIFAQDKKLGYFEGKLVRPAKAVASKPVSNVLSAYATGEKWIEVDLSDQVLRAWDGDKIFLQSPVSTGLPWWPTPTGEFKIWIKLRFAGMEGGEGKYYYNLPNVPYVMFFENDDVPGYLGYGLHGTYWHSDFGTQRSHGCVNLPTDVAGQLYEWVGPAISGVASVVESENDNPGTRVVIHE